MSSSTTSIDTNKFLFNIEAVKLKSGGIHNKKNFASRKFFIFITPVFFVEEIASIFEEHIACCALILNTVRIPTFVCACQYFIIVLAISLSVGCVALLILWHIEIGRLTIAAIKNMQISFTKMNLKKILTPNQLHYRLDIRVLLQLDISAGLQVVVYSEN